MKTQLIGLSVMACLLVMLTVTSSPIPSGPNAGPSIQPALTAVQPLSFEENRGQYASPAPFVARGSGANVFVEPDAITLQLVESVVDAGEKAHRRGDISEEEPSPQRGVNIRLEFENASEEAYVEGSSKLPGVVNHYSGGDPAQWLSGPSPPRDSRVDSQPMPHGTLAGQRASSRPTSTSTRRRVFTTPAFARPPRKRVRVQLSLRRSRPNSRSKSL